MPDDKLASRKSDVQYKTGLFSYPELDVDKGGSQTQGKNEVQRDPNIQYFLQVPICMMQWICFLRDFERDSRSKSLR